MLTIEQVKKAIKEGHLEEAYKEVRRYGVIKWQHDHLFRGFCTTLAISYGGETFEFTLKQGQVKIAGF